MRHRPQEIPASNPASVESLELFDLRTGKEFTVSDLQISPEGEGKNSNKYSFPSLHFLIWSFQAVIKLTENGVQPERDFGEFAHRLAN